MGKFAETGPGWVGAPDGVQLAYWTSGSGPVVLLVHGTTSDHTTFAELAPRLMPSRTVVTFDRRGRGRSGDGQGPYRVESEFRDVAAVAEHIAGRQGSPVDVISHSFGAFLALGAAMRTSAIRALVAYSPGFGAAYPPGSLERIDGAAESDDADTALQIMFSEIIGMPESEIQAMRRSPVWQVRIEVARTVARECRADESYLRDHSAGLATVTTPVLVLSGAENAAQKQELAHRLAGLLPRSAVVEMAGQGHAAHHFAPGELARISLRFFGDPEYAVGGAGTAPSSGTS